MFSYYPDDFAAAVANVSGNDNTKSEIKTCDLDTCSVSTTVPCTKGSRTSSHISLPGLDWDAQVKTFFRPTNMDEGLEQVVNF